MLPLSELFDTLQGEATWAGTPSTFVRLQGCDVGCAFCDTKFTWHMDERNVRDLAEVVAKTKSAEPTYALASADALMAEISKRGTGHVVITGGEPCVNDLTELTSRITSAGAHSNRSTGSNVASR